MPSRVCSIPGCPTVYPKSYGPRCPVHARTYEEQRGSRQQRGYGTDHDRKRRAWAVRVATGKVRCWRCGQPITPSEPWDLGHDDNDRTITRGPEHAYRCNRSAGGRSAHHPGG